LILNYSIGNSREDSSWSVVTGETGLAHTGTIVDNEGSDFVLPNCQSQETNWGFETTHILAICRVVGRI
jgi:hypothetical protein